MKKKAHHRYIDDDIQLREKRFLLKEDEKKIEEAEWRKKM